MDTLAAALDRLKTQGTKPKYIYTIPTIQNPTATIMSLDRRKEFLRLSQAHGVPIFEDECYSDLVFGGTRPPALYALDQQGPKAGNVIFLASFSKSIAPALRCGYLVAQWPLMSRILAIKTDGGSAAIEQMILAEYCTKHFDNHVADLNKSLAAKLDTLIEALEKNFGTAAEFERPPGGIFLWIKLPDSVDTTKLTQLAGKEGIAINPGVEWTTNPERGVRRLRICYANPTHENLREGVAKLAEICHREFGVPIRSGNVTRAG
jgi:2-aminoadipate transaminase